MFWVRMTPAVLRLLTSGFRLLIGTASSWMNTTTEHGAKMPRTSTTRKTLPWSGPRKLGRLSPRMPITSANWRLVRCTMKAWCHCARMLIFTSPGHRSVPSPLVSLSRNRFTTGRIPTSRPQRRRGKAPRILTLNCLRWWCWPTRCQTASARLHHRASSMNLTWMSSSGPKANTSFTKSMSRSGLTLSVALIWKT